jgi:hypothetical protein
VTFASASAFQLTAQRGSFTPLAPPAWSLMNATYRGPASTASLVLTAGMCGAWPLIVYGALRLVAVTALGVLADCGWRCAQTSRPTAR